jgi:hypothetical protein
MSLKLYKNRLIAPLLVILAIIVSQYALWDDKPKLFLDSKTGPWSVGYANATQLYQIKEKIGANFLDTNTVKDTVSLDFLADPFFIADSNGIYIFAEHITDKHGDISCFFTPNPASNQFKYLGVVLDEPFHLSYPQVFKHNHKYYMLPETQRGGAVFLYETDSFPFNWRRSKTLIDQSNIKDPTILFHQEQVYIFGTQHDHLYVWTASGLEEAFKKNPKPLLTGSESRPGGRIFEYEGKLILPIQNNVSGYGTGLSLYEISIKGSATTLKRIEKFFLKPEPALRQFSHGMHHLDFQKYEGGYFAVFDGNILLDSTQRMQLKSYLKYLYLNLKNKVMTMLN